MPHDLYHTALVDAARAAAGAGRLAGAHGSATLDNPLCGDRVRVDVRLHEDRVEALGHEVRGCLLCEAAASMIGARAPEQSVAALRAVCTGVEEMIREGDGVPAGWPELEAFMPVRGYRSRHRCVLLPFEALSKALDAAASGVDGLLLVDLPPEESAEVLPSLQQAGIDLITLLAPTTPPKRMKDLAELGSGYLYYVSMTGVTGSRRLDPEDIRQAVSAVRKLSPIPVGVGFGITTPEDAATVGSYADAVVVGSALVKFIAEHGRSPELQSRVHSFISDLRQALDTCR